MNADRLAEGVSRLDPPANPVLDWFHGKGWTPFPFQRAVWQAYLDGESGLIHSPTGTGKTYAAWLGALMRWTAAHEWRGMEDPRAVAYVMPPPVIRTAPALKKPYERKPPAPREPRRADAPPLIVLWITPLRALAGDTTDALLEPIRALGLPWTVETRTSDTSSTVRGRQKKRLPSALVTTPESLSLLLSQPDAHERFASLEAVVVDEWHELMASKRGVQTELGLARLRRWNPALRVWGVSATMGNLDTALRALIGAVDYDTGEIPRGRLIEGEGAKTIVIDSVIPPRMERFPWAGHLGLKLLPQVLGIVEASKSTLIFTNTRSQTERWYSEILDARPEWAGEIALHHGSLDSDTRAWVENHLRAGDLRLVVCTSSLDLGVDFPAVDRVIQISSPKGVARLVQRAGRSGHQPGASSRVTCVPGHALELIEVAAARAAMYAGRIEDRTPISAPLDVLVQHLVTIGLGGGFTSDDLYREVRTTYSYRHLQGDEWVWALDFVTRGGAALHAYDQYHRLRLEGDRYVSADDQSARAHRMSIGTIVGDATLNVQFLRGAKIGAIDESFVARLKPGDKFTLAGKVLEFVRIREMTVWVRAARSVRGVIPRWTGGSLPLSDELTEAVRDQLERARRGELDSPELQALRPILELQAKWSRIPAADELLIEQVKTREGVHLFIFPFEGKLVHEGLAALTAYRLARLQPITFTIASNDYGFELLAPEAPPLETALPTLFSAENLLDDIAHSLNAAELSRRQFREVARVAGLIVQRFPGGQKTVKQLQSSSGLIYDVLRNYDPTNRLLEQAEREVLERQLEAGRLRTVLDRVARGRVSVIQPPRPTPFAFPLMVERLRETVSSETLEDRIHKMIESYERWADR